MGNGGGVAAFKIDRLTGAVTFINEVPSGGAYPNYIVTDKQNRYAFVGHHGHHEDVVTKSVLTERGTYIGQRFFDEASVAMYPIREDGSIGECCDLKILTGSSINYRGQWTAHSHSVRLDPSDRYLLTCDKGSDFMKVYRIDYENGRLTEVCTLKTEIGMQPRHMVFHPALPILYVCAEAHGYVCAYTFDNETGQLEFFDREPTVPPYFTGIVKPADIKIHHSGRFLYVSNRVYNTIGCLHVDDEGRMKLFDNIPCGGANPRGMNFDLSGDVLYVVNVSGNIVPFNVSLETGGLHHTGYQLVEKTPTYIHFLEMS
jgi:6-phosphogluconolactonase